MSSYKKYLIITNHSYMLWQFRREVIAALLERGEVIISTPFVGHEDDFSAMGCRCIETKFERRSVNPLHELRLFQTYKKLLKQERPDMVLTYSIKPNIYAGLACRRNKTPYCVNVQGLGTAFQSSGIAKVATVLYKAALRDAKAVFFENTENAAEFVRRNITPADRQIVVPGAGVNLDHFSCTPYPPEKDGIHFLFLGRIMREKGVDELFEAARRLKQQFGDQVVLDLVGFFEDEYKASVDRLVQDGVAIFHGFQAEPRPYYSAAHCIVMPSYHEGMSNVLLEAAATGRAVITSDIPGCREAVDAGRTGFLAQARNADSLYAAMKAFMGLSAAEREQMGVLGRRKMEAEFDRQMVIDRVLREVI